MNKMKRVNIPVPNGKVVLQCEEQEGVLRVVTVVCNNTLLKLGGFPDTILVNRPHLTIDSLEICLRGNEFQFLVNAEPTLAAVSVLDFLRTFRNVMAAIAIDFVDMFDYIVSVAESSQAVDKPCGLLV